MECVALVERFEVWATRALTHHLLLSHKSDSERWSNLLQIPSASYMRDVIEDESTSIVTLFDQLWNDFYQISEADGHRCALSVFPDVYTWPEFLRVAYMVSLLGDKGLRELVHSSHCSSGTREHRERCNIKFAFQTADVVALWVRAQFCSMSRRHLVSVFQVMKPDHERNRCLKPLSSEDNNGLRYSAIFKGNHRGAPRCSSETPLVNSLVEWAVVNQVFFTHARFLDAWKQPALELPISRPPRPPVTSKRGRRTPEEISDWEANQLMRACQSFVLRLVCVRHSILSALIYATADEFYLAEEMLCRSRSGNSSGSAFMFEPGLMIHHPLTGPMIEANVLGRVRDRPVYATLTDRKLPRIDRRVFFGRYDNNPRADDDPSSEPIDRTGLDLFYRNVEMLLQLLQTFLECTDEAGISSLQVELALTEFRQLYLENFCGRIKSDGLLVAAQSLLDEDYEQLVSRTATPSAIALKELLVSFPPPWIDRCAICEGPFLKPTASAEPKKPRILICGCCSKTVHPGIPPTATPPPDFRGSRSAELQWDLKVIHLKRSLKPDGSLPRYGMVVRSAQQCAEALDGLLAGKYLVTEFDGAANYPVAFSEGSEYSGCVITDIVPGSLSDLKGCKIGDVIVGLEPIDIAAANGDEEVKFVRSETYTVRKLSEDYVMQLLRLRATRMKLIVARPRGSVARQVAEWTRQLRAANNALLGSLRANECLWFCDKCRAGSVNHTETSAERMRSKALLCLGEAPQTGIIRNSLGH